MIKPRAAIAIEIARLHREIDRLEAAAELLGEEDTELDLTNPALPPCQAVVMATLTKAGERGMRVHEVIAAVQQIHPYTPGTIKQTLHLLKNNDLASLDKRIWYANQTSGRSEK